MAGVAPEFRDEPDGTPSDVELYQGSIQFGDAGPTLDGRVLLVWEPEPRIEFEIEGEEGFDREVMDRVQEWDKVGLVLALSDGRACVGHPDRWDYGQGRVTVRGAIDPVSYGEPRVREIRANVVNLPLYNRPEHSELIAGGWRIRMKDLGSPDTEERGFFVTSEITLARTDGNDFEAVAAVDMLEAFDHFATIAQGSWASHVVPVGSDGMGRVVWVRWYVGRLDRFETGDGWATEYVESKDALEAMWPGYLAKWSDAAWRPTVKTLAALLAEATAHTNGEAALLIVDVVLELLSWAVVVGEGAMVSAEGHDRLFGPDRLRLLLAVAGIDRRVPTGLREFGAAATRLKWADGPHAIAQIRDAVVHPRKRAALSEIPEGAIAEAQFLARDYAHGALVRLFGGTGWTAWADRWLPGDEPAISGAVETVGSAAQRTEPGPGAGPRAT